MGSHTPSPWTSEREICAWDRTISGNHYDDGDDHVSTTVARVCGNATSQQVTEANARLIAAAPDLLEACKAWIDYFDYLDAHSDPDDPLAVERRRYHAKRLDLTRSAIAKATGAPSPARAAREERGE